MYPLSRLEYEDNKSNLERIKIIIKAMSEAVYTIKKLPFKMPYTGGGTPCRRLRRAVPPFLTDVRHSVSPNGHSYIRIYFFHLVFSVNFLYLTTIYNLLFIYFIILIYILIKIIIIIQYILLFIINTMAKWRKTITL